MKIYFVGILMLLLISCDTGAVKENVLSVESVVVDDVVQTIKKPSNVITPESWKNYITDIEIVIMFYKGDSLKGAEKEVVNGLRKEFSSLDFHEFYSDDEFAQVFINDTLAFDITNFLVDYQNGYVLLKPNVEPHFESLSSSLSAQIEKFNDFYEN